MDFENQKSFSLRSEGETVQAMLLKDKYPSILQNRLMQKPSLWLQFWQWLNK